MTVAEFADYRRAQQDVSAAFLDKPRFTDMSLVNIAKAGLFSADRAVKQYADEIWHL
jgi:starch phosphorylase